MSLYATNVESNKSSGGGSAGTVTSFAFTNQDNVTGTVTNSTTTPTLALAPTSATPAASSFAAWDANKNLSANNALTPVTVTITGTTTLTIASTQIQLSTGIGGTTYVLPTTGVTAGTTYTISNKNSGGATINASGGSTIVVLAQNTQAIFTAIVATPTTPAQWNYIYALLNSTIPLAASYASVYYPDPGTYFWSANSATFVPFTLDTGTVPTPTVIQNSNFAAIAPEGSNDAGISFTAPYTGTIKVTAIAQFWPGTTGSWAVQLLETNSVGLVSGSSGYAGGANQSAPVTLEGYMPVVASTSYNLQFQGQSTGSGLSIGSAGSGGSQLQFNLQYV